MTLPKLIFIYFAVTILAQSLLVITRRNPVHSVLWMLLLFIHIAALFVFLGAEFLAAIQIILYAGAVLVLFLFVLMLLNLQKKELEIRFQNLWPLGLASGMVLILIFLLTLSNVSVHPDLGPYSMAVFEAEGNLMTVGKVLYTEFLLPFEIASLILLVAIIGAVVLAKRRLN